MSALHHAQALLIKYNLLSTKPSATHLFHFIGISNLGS